MRARQTTPASRCILGIGPFTELRAELVVARNTIEATGHGGGL